MAQSQESGDEQSRTVTVELQDGIAQELEDGQRLAWDGDGAISMTLRVGPNTIWFDKQTCPAGIRLPAYDDGDGSPSWPLGGGGMRPAAGTKLAGLLRCGWELVDNDVGLNR